MQTARSSAVSCSLAVADCCFACACCVCRDFISLTPESSHMIAWVLSDRAIPRSYRMMQGFGVNTFVLVNAERRRTFVKFHWRPVLGVHSLTWDECLKLNGVDPDFHRRDLWEAIDTGAYPEYEFGVQLIPEADEDRFDFDLLDCTKLVPEEQVPVKWVGKMVLNKNPDEFFPETEQVAYCTQHVVPGIDFSDDPMLHGRNFSYLDTQLIRLGGPNFNQLPINRPICPVLNNQRDGFSQHKIHRGKLNYYPNRESLPRPGNDSSEARSLNPAELDTQLTEEQKHIAALRASAFVTYEEKIAGMKTRLRGPKFQEHISQATLFYNSMSAPEKEHITNAAIFELGHVDDVNIRERVIYRLNNIDHGLAATVGEAVGVAVPAATNKNHGKSSPALSQLNTAFASIKSRKVAILLADGYDAAQVAAIYAAVKAQSAVPMVVSVRKGTIYSSSFSGSRKAGSKATADFTAVDAPFSLFASKSVQFDSTVVVDGKDSIATLSQYGETTGWIAQMFKHYKAILAIGGGISLLQAANLDRLSDGLKLATEADGTNGVNSFGVVTVWKWNAAAVPSNGAQEESKTSGGVMGAVSAVVTAASAAVGAATGVKVSEYMPNDAASLFFDGMKKHRDWTRDVARVPA